MYAALYYCQPRLGCGGGGRLNRVKQTLRRFKGISRPDVIYNPSSEKNPRTSAGRTDWKTLTDKVPRKHPTATTTDSF